MLMTIATHSSLIPCQFKKPGKIGFGLGKNKPSIFAMLTAFSQKYYPNLTIYFPQYHSLLEAQKENSLNTYGQ